ncbi:hypothetical protein [Mesorhizobium sp. A623]
MNDQACCNGIDHFRSGLARSICSAPMPAWSNGEFPDRQRIVSMTNFVSEVANDPVNAKEWLGMGAKRTGEFRAVPPGKLHQAWAET